MKPTELFHRLIFKKVYDRMFWLPRPFMYYQFLVFPTYLSLIIQASFISLSIIKCSMSLSLLTKQVYMVYNISRGPVMDLVYKEVIMDLTIAGLGVAGLVFGVVEALKSFGLESTMGKRASALATGVVFTGLAYGIHEQLIPQVYVPYINWSVYSIAGGVAAMGYYDFAKNTVKRLHE